MESKTPLLVQRRCADVFSARRSGYGYSMVVFLVWVTSCAIMLPACEPISAIQESALMVIGNSPPLRDGTRFFVFTLNEKPFALLSYSVRSVGSRICVDRSLRTMMLSGDESRKLFSVEYDVTTLDLVTYRRLTPQDDYGPIAPHGVPETQLADCSLVAVRDDATIHFSWCLQGSMDTHSTDAPQPAFVLDSNDLGAESLELVGRYIDWSSSEEQTVFMVDADFVTNSLTRALAVLQANITVAGQQEISVGSKRYLAVVGDIGVPLARFRCWYDSATLDLLRWEMDDSGIVAVRVDGEDIALSVPDQRALASVMADRATIPTGHDPEKHPDAKGFSVQVDLWAVAMAPDLESAIESAGQEFDGSVAYEKGCWHIVGTFTTSRVSNGSWAGAYETADGSPLLAFRDDGFLEYTRSEGAIEADDPAIRAKAVEILGGESMLSACTRWEAVERICRWVSENVMYEITQDRTARATRTVRQEGAVK